jgi:hypothetical protein
VIWAGLIMVQNVGIRVTSARRPMVSRVCLDRGQPGCVTFTSDSSRCRPCTRRRQQARDAERGTAHERGYDAEHRREREQWRPLVESGEVACRRCAERILPGEDWDLGHDVDRSAPRAPEHAARCNRAAGGRRGARMRRRRG